MSVFMMLSAFHCTLNTHYRTYRIAVFAAITATFLDVGDQSVAH